jgi:uncharacterized protein (TIGR01319 family)
VSVLCLDVGSTWTKGALVSAEGDLLGTAAHATTPPEVLHGIEAVTGALGAAGLPALVCSSAGGGLRLAVVGQERLVSAEAGYRVALSAGAKVVHVATGELDGAGLRALRAARPDVLLLVGGTDGGDAKVLLHNARRLATNRIGVPVVLAGNVKARDEAVGLLHATGRTVVPTDNVLPDVGELAPGPARQAIREVFLRHVIGGKGLSRGPRFRRMVRTVTPDAVLSGVALLAAARPTDGAVLVVDVGGATTDVYSAVSVSTADPETHAVALPADRRTVEGDIGMRWGAAGIVAEAAVERLLSDEEAAALTGVADRLVANPDTVESEVDVRLATLATVLAVRRHLRMVDGRLGPRGAGLVVLSGGVFRHAETGRIDEIGHALRTDPALRPHLHTATITVDRDYVLAPAGLLAAAGHPHAAVRLLTPLSPAQA